jgi:N6-L-threonylcarbamoyladenine synthase
MIILGIETTCDETAASVIEANSDNIFVLSNVISSQVKLHSKWGGVVPNLAAREHLKNILPVLSKAFKKAKILPGQIDLIAVSGGPGLIPALLIGISTAKTLSYLWQKPLVGVHHIEGHIYANFIRSLRPTLSLPRRGIKGEIDGIKFPILCLVVSGGHTQLVLMKKHLDYKIIGQTLDDAAGEAFDKVARILNLGYPGGPAIAARAANFQISNYKFQKNSKVKNKDVKIQDTRYKILDTVLPRPMINSKDFNFSFSGLKTAVLYETKKHPQLLKNNRYVVEICQKFQQAVCDVLISKTMAAAKKYRPKTIMLAGGVSANLELRKQLEKAIKLNLPDTKYKIPDTKYCVDNAAMIATAGYWRWKKDRIKNKKIFVNNWSKLDAEANLKL